MNQNDERQQQLKCKKKMTQSDITYIRAAIYLLWRLQANEMHTMHICILMRH